MANDAASKPTSTPTESTLSNATDQQKVPPLRIVLNSAGNQTKSSTAAAATITTASTTVGTQQTNTKRERVQDAKTESTGAKVGGRVRIKLGTNKQQPSGKSNNNSKSSEISAKRANGGNTTNDKLTENINEDSASNFGHLRRITRRSQRAVQSISNEDEESISSMTSTDENQNTNNNQISSDNFNAQDSEQSNSATLTSSSATVAGSSATNGSSNAETPRRYKRRKVETSESQSIDCDNLLGSQNYRLPNQNSFELFKNIRKQVDKKLKNLSIVPPRIPYGFRDYMLTRGAYLLDGNKLGNGTSLFMNEDGGLNSVPLGKYRVLRYNRTSYSVPNRAKVPLGLPVNSPLYDLFVEQEKERYRMRMQHIKEREKLTLAAEQEIMRVYNQAALAAADQAEPFSACTMLKHQEIYNYMDTNGVTILSREDAHQDQVQPDGVRTRRRQHGYISPSPPTRKTSDVDEPNPSESVRKGSENSTSPTEDHKSDIDTQQSTDIDKVATTGDGLPSSEDTSGLANEDGKSAESANKSDDKKKSIPDDSGICPITPPDNPERLKDEEDVANELKQDAPNIELDETKPDIKTEIVSPAHVPNDEPSTKTLDERNQATKSDVDNQTPSETSKSLTSTNDNGDPDKAEGQAVMKIAETSNPQVPSDVGTSLSVEDKRNQNMESFLSQLQEVDDKWEKIRHEMLVRHRNEAESLHAIQKLEWEWKTKEIGACDVRTTPIIDNTLVPKLSIYSQDY